MLAFNPTMRVEVWKLDGSDVYGQPVLKRGTDEMVAPTKLIFQDQHTTVRTDSSGSHGSAYETTATVTLLARANTRIAMGDKLIVMGRPVRVTYLHPRFTATGAPHHTEVRCVAWV